MTSEYSGHKSKQHWNVSLWLYNDEATYRTLQDACKRSSTHLEAARRLVHEHLPAKTPDGFSYTVETVLVAINEEKLGR